MHFENREVIILGGADGSVALDSFPMGAKSSPQCPIQGQSCKGSPSKAAICTTVELLTSPNFHLLRKLLHHFQV